jgi:hypothetical protein
VNSDPRDDQMKVDGGLSARTLAVLGATATASFASGCDAGSPASPMLDGGTFEAAVVESGAGVDATVSQTEGGPVGAPNTVCPDGMAPTFPSIFSLMLSTGGCGTGQPYDCHSSTGALPQAEGGTGSLLDFSLDAAAVYEELLGVDAGGQPAVNIDGDAGGVVLRVVPGDASASLLYIKLALPALSDPRYGKAMPPNQAVCPSALDAVGTWIDNGAAAK